MASRKSDESSDPTISKSNKNKKKKKKKYLQLN